MASKQDDCDVFDSWENLEDTDILERKLKAILPRDEPEMEAKSCNKTAVNVILLGDEALRSQYVPPEPTVKILKRPARGGAAAAATATAGALNGDSKPKVPIKTLKQRELEYAEARLRILGEAHCSDKEDRVCSIQNKPQPPPQPQPQPRADAGAVLRMPKGPDGSKGFNIRR